MAGQVDGFLTLRDARIYSLENLDWLATRCMQFDLVCLGRNDELAEKGMLITISPGPREVALQAVSLVHLLGSGDQKPEDIGVVSPLGSQVYLNLTTAKDIGLNVSDETLQAVTEVVW